MTENQAGMTGLSDQVVLVTGGTSGIGFATASYLLDNGAKVVITGRNEARLNSAAERLNDVSDGGKRLLTSQVDASDLAGMDALMEQIRERFGRLNGVFANAGMGLFKNVTETE